MEARKEAFLQRRKVLRNMVFEGIVKTSGKITYVIADRGIAETFDAWIHTQAAKLEGKRVKVSVELIETEQSSKPAK